MSTSYVYFFLSAVTQEAKQKVVGSIPGSFILCATVSLGKMLNPELHHLHIEMCSNLN